MQMSIIVVLAMVSQLLFLLSDSKNVHGRTLLQENFEADTGVKLLQQDQHVVMSNGIVSVTLTAPGGAVTNITYKGSDNLLETRDKEPDRGHWDVVWTKQGRDNMTDNLVGTSYKVIAQNPDQTEISFTTTWTVGSTNVPINVDKRFHYMAMSDVRQRIMPTFEDRTNGKPLEYPEAVKLTNPSNPALKGEVDDKYLYSCDNKDSKVHGWVSSASNTPVGFWMITPSNEFRTGGPIKQDLTSHVGPFVLSMFISRHYAGEDIDLKFQTQDYWKKVFGPVYVYLNSDASAKTTPSVLWNDAKQRMEKEVASWPYSFPLSTEFVKSNQRGSVSGQLLVHDPTIIENQHMMVLYIYIYIYIYRFVTKRAVPGGSAYVGLAAPGAAGSWQLENKGYQFWTQTDKSGNFMIKNVIPGTYSLFAWVPGTVGDYKHASDITITPGSNVKASNVVFKAPRKGSTLWEIGIPDRTAAEFFIPDASPQFKIHSYNHPVEKFREYGLWERYKDVYPRNDLVFTIGTSDYKKDWFFAHVLRIVGNGQYAATTWQILFDLKNVNEAANYTLQLALASANNAELQVRLNDPKSLPHFTTGTIGKDNAVARHGIHGLYHFYSINISGSRLVVGRNTIFLTQARNQGRLSEVMYDYIRLEGPA
ncbi:hypothetical protein BUALT_Bualt04G0034400 [Buddleja alternifolia]|uniref:rhamnogalacturonan endolyase n=1 Tax=Buddleja alternifolia TaxID=168488 RepID=A0AAV6XMC4_9LAMI|nr:hypothetical protein BUALT_Bualt04G0034400 [Buddleja alternifolia]